MTESILKGVLSNTEMVGTHHHKVLFIVFRISEFIPGFPRVWNYENGEILRTDDLFPLPLQNLVSKHMSFEDKLCTGSVSRSSVLKIFQNVLSRKSTRGCVRLSPKVHYKVFFGV
jgi:hypothetical protein